MKSNLSVFYASCLPIMTLYVFFLKCNSFSVHIVMGHINSCEWCGKGSELMYFPCVYPVNPASFIERLFPPLNWERVPIIHK